MQARFYDPVIGRFLQPDTIVPDPADPGAFNRYSYVYNNPLRYTDPTGRCGWDPTGGSTNVLGMCTRPAPAASSSSQPAACPAPAPGAACTPVLETIPSSGGNSCSWFSIACNFAVDTVVSLATDVCIFANNTTCTGEEVSFWDSLFATANVGITVSTGGGSAPLKAGGLRALSRAKPILPAALKLGRNAEVGVSVYVGVLDGAWVYAGVTSNIARREAQHGARLGVEELTTGKLTRGQARAIEQALIVDNPAFQNIRNSISPMRPYYDDAVAWGRDWLRRAGY
jgi:hypothetical protein